jgi:osmoprotectant transport system substrate-binding protein
MSRSACILISSLASCTVAAIAVAGCGSGSRQATAAASPTATVAQTTTALPGAGKPPIVIGDKNTTEQFLLGDLYYQALKAQGYSVTLNRNIGPTEVTIQAMTSGRLAMYPEYLNTWNSAVAGYPHGFRSERAAYAAAQRWALPHGFELLDPTPFSDTDAIAVTFNYGLQNNLTTIRDLRKVASTLTLGAPLQFQQSPDGLPAIERVYHVAPAAFKPLDVGAQYDALDQGTVQAADINTTDGALITGNYTLLKDPRNVFGWGNVVPVVSVRALDAEGPAFAATVNRVSALLTTEAMRQLNAAIELSHVDPALAAHGVAKQFLIEHGLIPATAT